MLLQRHFTRMPQTQYTQGNNHRQMQPTLIKMDIHFQRRKQKIQGFNPKLMFVNNFEPPILILRPIRKYWKHQGTICG